MAPVQVDDHSLLHIKRISQYVSLSPASLATPLPALCASIFSPLLLSYFPPAHGIVLAYEDVQLSSSPPASSSSRTPASKAQSHQSTTSSSDDDEARPELLLLQHVDEYSAPFLWATASFLVWRPRRNAYIAGRITHQSSSHITLSHLNTFPVSILKEHLPAAWKWHSDVANKMKKGWDGRISDEGGWWVDGQGEAVKSGEEVQVRIRDFDGRMDAKSRGKGFLRVEGSLLSAEEEAEALKKGAKGKGKTKAVSALKPGRELMEVD